MNPLRLHLPLLVGLLLLLLTSGAASARRSHYGCDEAEMDTNDTPFLLLPATVNLWYSEDCLGATFTSSVGYCPFHLDFHLLVVHVPTLSHSCETGVLIPCWASPPCL